MSRSPSLIEHLAPDSVRSLRRAAVMRAEEADELSKADRPTAAIDLLGYAVEMTLGAAAFRAAGYNLTQPISRDERVAKVKRLKETVGADGRRLMSNDPHDFVGWARYLDWQLRPTADRDRKTVLSEAVRRAALVYDHWRPELRYKVATETERELAVVRREAEWFLQRIESL